MRRFHRVDPTAPGIERRRRGRGFSYTWPTGAPVHDRSTLARIRRLAIPPAWTDVWICTDADGHLQALGTDSVGRRQYLYHPDWRERQDTKKFRRVEDFARALPALRDVVASDLERDGMPRERVLAAAVRVLDRSTFRIGSETYAERNGSFGLATIRKSDVRIEGGALVFEYTGKGGSRRIHRVSDAQLTPLVAELKRRRTGGRTLLAFRDNGAWRQARSGDINTYIKDVVGEEHSAKDFRTWHATMMAALEIARVGSDADTATGRRRAIAGTVRRVAEELGNTPAVCRASYIDPRIFDRFRAGRTIRPALARLDRSPGETQRHQIEDAVLALLAGDELRAAA